MRLEKCCEKRITYFEFRQTLLNVHIQEHCVGNVERNVVSPDCDLMKLKISSELFDSPSTDLRNFTLPKSIANIEELPIEAYVTEKNLVREGHWEVKKEESTRSRV
jgi:hypothetical protein